MYSESDPDFDHRAYVIKATPDESPIDIKQILNFLEINELSPDAIRSSILELSWQAQMSKLLKSVVPLQNNFIE
ncbi:hypothetical protein D3C87_1906340 [compost metagenome]